MTEAAKKSPGPEQATEADNKPIYSNGDKDTPNPGNALAQTHPTADLCGPVSFCDFAAYSAAGLHFVRIPRVGGKPTKGPRGYGWNLAQTPANPNGYTADIEQASGWIRAGDNLGLALVPSGIVSFDVDDLDDTRRVLSGLGLDFAAWFADPRRAEIRSGKPGKAKLLFRVGTGPVPPSKKLNFGRGKESKSIFELRHGSTEGQTLQDVLPPSTHPDTGLPYELVGDVRDISELPGELLALWQAWPDILKTFDPAYEPPKPRTPPKSATPTHQGERDPVAEFNAGHDLETLLEAHGYRRKGRRYLRPGSESGIPGLTLLDGKDGRTLCYSHGGDDLNDGHAHDAFDVYRLLVCGGDWKQALGWNPELTAHNRRLFTERKRAEKAADRSAKAAAALALGSLYIEDAGRICKNEGDVPAPLCNFTARIVEEVLTDDGETAELAFVVEGRLCTGTPLERKSLPAGEFYGMAWVPKLWGVRAIVNAGNAKDHIRAAIQERSMAAPRRTIYAHTGWREIDGEPYYLHAGGALGATGNRADIEVNPGPGNMALYRLPDPPEGRELVEAVEASLELLMLAPQKPALGALLLALIYRAPLGFAAMIDHAAWLVGYTGARKSEAAAMALAHFGQGFDARHFPAAWVDSPGVMEVKAHAAKDAVFVVDDFKPHGSKSDIDAHHGKADRLIRGVGNQAGRGRLQANLKQRATYHPRGFVLATGEDIARGQSLRARMTVATVSRDPHDPRKGDIDLDRLTRLQGHARAGTLAKAMAGYIQWLAPQFEELKRTLPEDIRALRDKAAHHGLTGHSRGPSDYASLAAGINTFARFAVERGALPPEEVHAFKECACRALWALMEEQGEHQASQDDVTRFLSLLASALSSGRCHVFDLDGTDKGCPTNQSGHSATMLGWFMDPHGAFQPKGQRIGWLEGDTLYLDGEAAYTAATDYARDQGGNIEVTQKTIFQRIYERGFLARTETEGGKTRLQIRKRIHGANARVYALRLVALIDDETP